MTDVGTIASAYGLTLVAIAGYAAWVLRRGRSLGHSLKIGLGAETDDRGPAPDSPAESNPDPAQP